jgi:Immunoglobulin I-set domain
MRALKLVVVVLALQAAVVASAQRTTLIGPTNTNWRYLADGSDQGTAWSAPGFVDTSWSQGRGLFGNDTGYPYPFNSYVPGPSTNGGGPITVYYRTHFTWSGSTAGVVLSGTNYVDDGDVVYLNNVEITRFNMNAGVPTSATTAPAANPGGFPNVGGGEPVRVVMEIPLDTLTNGNANPLIVGDNVIAVEVHNQSGTSSDHVFGMWLFGQRSAAPCTDGIQPTNRTIIEGRNTTFTVVQGPDCGAPAPTFQWYRNVGGGEELILDATSASYTRSNTVPADAGEYYVRLINPSAPGGVDSRHAVLTINPDVTPPQLLSARVDTSVDLKHFILKTDEELCNPASAVPCVFMGNPVNSLDNFSWHVYQADDLGTELGVAEITMIDPTTYSVRTDADRNPDKAYRIQIDDQQPDFSIVIDIYGNRVPVGTFVTAAPEVTAISVGATGSITYTFDEAPGAKEFTTFNFAGGANGTVDTADSFGAKVVALDGATINVALAGATGTPPAAGGSALWASDGHYLITRPTGVEGEVIMAHLRNDSGATKTGLMLDYDLTVEIPVVEEVLGHLVYYSFSGAPGSWQPVVIPGDGAPGHKTAIVDLTATPWAAGADLYVLFADDNGSGSPDDANEIDNFRASFPSTTVPVSITQSPSSVSTNEGATVELTVAVGGSPPFHYQWFKGASPLSNGGNISGATTATLTISNAVSGDSGTYFARVSNDVPSSADSAAATVTIIPDLTRPVLTRAVSVNSTTVVLDFNKQLAASAQTTSHYTLSGGATVSAAVLVNGANSAVVTLTTSARGLAATTLTITGLTDNRASLNLINPNPTVVVLTGSSIVAGAEWGGSWSYNTNNLDGTPTWKDVAFVPGADWGTGNALFGTEVDAGTVALFPTPIATPIRPNNIDPFDFVTAYFRKTVTLPAIGGGATYVLEHFIDDGAVFYWDGAEFGRYNMAPTGPVVYSTKATAAGDATHQSISLPASANAGGTHTLAVEVHQGGATTSSDMLFGAQIVAVATPPSLSISHSGGSNIVSWTADSNWRLVRSAVVTGPYTAVAGNPFHTFTVPPAANTNNAFFQLQFNFTNP